jgi:hypothetical protein
MSKSDNKDTIDQGNKLIQMGEQMFSMGSKMNPNPMPMDQDKNGCPMCKKMMEMDS